MLLISYVLSASVGSCLHLEVPPPSWIVTSQEVGLVAMLKCNCNFKMAAASSSFIFETKWIIRWVKLVIQLLIDTTLVIDCIFIMISSFIWPCVSILWCLGVYSYIKLDIWKFDMLETIAHRWKCGRNFASLLVCYSESVCIVSVNCNS